MKISNIAYLNKLLISAKRKELRDLKIILMEKTVNFT